MSLKIYVYAICKNEEKFAGRWMDSMTEADGVYVLDTGSTDSTPALLSSLGAHVHCRRVTPWRFDDARNLSLSLVPQDADLCVCTDLDEVFAPGWRLAMENALQPDVHQLKYRYTWSFQPDGSEGHVFYIEKAHRRNGFQWEGAVHEVLRWTKNEPCICRTAPGVQLSHYPDAGKSRAQYLPLLELAVREDPQNDRNMHYLGREYMFCGQWEKAIETLTRHLSLTTAIWADERCASMRFLARCCGALGRSSEKESWLLQACAQAPHLREPWIDAARHYYEAEDWDAMLFFLRRALLIHQRTGSYITEPEAWGALPYDLCSLCYFHTGRISKALEMAQKALEISNGDERIRQNILFFRRQLAP